MRAVSVDLASARVNQCDPAHKLQYDPARKGAPPTSGLSTRCTLPRRRAICLGQIRLLPRA